MKLLDGYQKSNVFSSINADVIVRFYSRTRENDDNYRLYGIVIGGICCIKVVAGIRIKAQPLSEFRR